MTIVFIGEEVEKFWVLASGKKKFKFVTENAWGYLGMTHDAFNPLIKRFGSRNDAAAFAKSSCSSASKAVAAAIPRELMVKLL